MFFICVFLFFWHPKLTIQNNHVDVGLVRLARLHRLDRCNKKPTTLMVQNPHATKALTELEHNLERLTLDNPDAGIDDFPLHYEMHTMGVPRLISHLLQ